MNVKTNRCNVKRWLLKSFIAIFALFSISCAEGYELDPTFSPTVQNSTLNSPEAENIQFVPSPDGSSVKIEWPVVHGAGGYEFTLFINDDPNNPIPVGEVAEIVDGCSAVRPLIDDTKYKVSIKTIGNETYNNQTAGQASEREFSTLLPTYAVIPSGTDIYQWFQENPIPEDSIGVELAYVLEPNGDYTMSGKVDFGKQKITFRGDKLMHANITMGANGRLMTTAGLKVKFLDIDCSEISGSSSDASFLLFSSNPDPDIKGTGDYYIINDPIMIQSCNIKGVQRHLIFDNKVKYCPAILLIDDCLVEMETTQEQAIVFFNQGFANDFTLKNSTFWQNSNALKNNNYFLQYNNSGRPDRAGFVNGSVSYLNNTFYNICYNKQWGNYSGFAGRSNVYWNMIENIFVDSGNAQVARRFLGGRANQPTATFRNNSYWFDGAYASGEASWDNGVIIETDPQLKNPQNGDFTVQGTEQLAGRTGDPRWLPEITEIQ